MAEPVTTMACCFQCTACARALTVSVNYTLSHCIADIVKTSQTAAEYVIPGDRSSSRGNCGSDRRQAFNSSSVYQTPGFSNSTLKRSSAIGRCARS